MTILEFLQSCLECGLEEYPFIYYCDCLDQYGNTKRSKINLDNKVRNKNGRLEYFFKGFQNSCHNISLHSNIILRAYCEGPDGSGNDTTYWSSLVLPNGKWSDLDLSNYFYMKNGIIKSY